MVIQLEEGFRDVLKEVKGLKRSSVGSDGTRSPPSELLRRGKAKGKKRVGVGVGGAGVRTEAEVEAERMGSSL